MSLGSCQSDLVSHGPAQACTVYRMLSWNCPLKILLKQSDE